MVCAGRKANTAFWAWTASIVVHLIVLTAFGAVKFSPYSKARNEQRPKPVAEVGRIEKLARSTPIIPKPKIKRPVSTANKSLSAIPVKRIFDTPKPARQEFPMLAKSAASSTSLLSSAKIAISPHRIEFFGSSTDQREICYLVDCSGSMQGMLGQVRKKLRESVESLQPDQYFYIIFFGGNKLSEFGDGRLVRATQKAKSAAYDFIDSARPAGQTNAMEALQRAVQIHNGRGASPSVIYFLTDGFELTKENVYEFSDKVANLLKQSAPTIKINTIGFWPANNDRKLLEKIAEQSGGECIFITNVDS